MRVLTFAASEWVFGINDPSIIAWIIVCFYLLGTLLCCRALLSPLVKSDSGKRILWMTLGFSLLLLGFNKQLDLHDLVMDLLSDMSSNDRQSTAWNGFLALFAVAMAGSGMWLGSKLLFHSNRELRWSYIAFLTLLFFQVLRFAPGPTGGLLAGHPFTEEEGLFHVHYIELIELPILIVICFWAYQQTSHAAANKNSDSDGLQRLAA